MTTPGDTAVDIFLQNYNCSQSVLVAFASSAGLEKKTALRLASPFGGGLARRGEVCGALTGALMALGLLRGTDTPASKDEIYRLSQQFMHRFEAEQGSILCRDLIGCDISTLSGHQAAADKGVFRSICPGLVRRAAGILEAVLKGE